MDEEDEIESNPSSSPVHQNGGGGGGGGGSSLHHDHHPVTVASAPPSHHHQTLTLALPIQNPRTTTGAGGTSGGGGREDCWSEGATSTLIDAWGERYLELSRGNLKQKHWKDVADIVSSREDYTKPSKTDVQCKNRIDTLKKKYKLEKAKISSASSSSSGGISKWNFFNRLDHLIGTNSKMIPPTATPAPMPTTPLQANNKVPVAIPVGLVHHPPPRTFYHHQSPPNHQNQHHYQQPQHISQMRSRRQQQQQQHHQQKRQHQKRKRYGMEDSDSSEPEASPDSTDSFPPETFNRKRPQFHREPPNSDNPIRPPAGAGGFRQNMGSSSKENNNNNNNNAGWGSSIMELTRAIMKFGEAYEQVETSKLQQVMEMEQQRMEFTKELELQRMQFFMKTQLELTQLNHGRRAAGNNHRRHNNSNNNNSDNSG